MLNINIETMTPGPGVSSEIKYTMYREECKGLFSGSRGQGSPGILRVTLPSHGKAESLNRNAIKPSLSPPLGQIVHFRGSIGLSPPPPGLKYIVFKAFAPDIRLDIQPDMRPDIWPDVWPDVWLDIRPDIIHGYYLWIVSMDTIHR